MSAEQEKDQIFFRNYSIIIALIVVAMGMFFVIAQMVGGSEDERAAERAAQTDKVTQPAGQVNVAGETPAAPEPAPASAGDAAAAPAEAVAGAGAATGADAGKQTYDGLCFSCHGNGLAAMIPQFGDKAAWEPRIAQGIEVLYTHAIAGFQGASPMPMPAKGGNPALSDDQVKAAVDYMVSSAK